MKRRITKKPNERKAELIEAARFLFDKNGVDKTRVSDIVQSIGVAQGVFYYYFRSKDEIVEVVANEIMTELLGDIQNVLENEEADFSNKLVDLIELYIGIIDQFMGDEEPALPDFDTEEGNRNVPMQKARDILLEHIMSLILSGAAAGQVKARFPDWTVQVLEAGLYQTARKKLPAREVIYILVEQALCMPQGSLLQHVKNKKSV